jgi:hypothetical protein
MQPNALDPPHAQREQRPFVLEPAELSLHRSAAAVELAGALRRGLHPVEVGRAERGTRDLRVSTVAKLARGLGVAACELLRGVWLG